MSFSNQKLTIVFHPMDGAGHLAACSGMAETLAARGHSISFLINEGFSGQFKKHGYAEFLLRRQQKSSFESAGNPVKVVASILKESLLNGKSPLQKMKDHQRPEEDDFMKGLLEKMIDFDPQIEQTIKSIKPDVIIIDHFLLPPSIARSNIPWVFLFSGNPLPIYQSSSLPPYGSGYSTASDPSSWTEFQAILKEIYIDRYEFYQLKLNRHFHYNASDEELKKIKGACFPTSNWLNIVQFPAELDYPLDSVTKSQLSTKKIFRVDAFCRKNTNEPFELPAKFAHSEQKLIYFSLGSMGSIDVDLMKRVIAVLGKTPHNIIVSKGPLADEYDLPDNCWGQGTLPQTQILPFVDLVISHGGNNTVTESICFGKPLIVLPLFADQYDNAQRIEETGFGVRLDTYHFEEHQLLDAVEKLISDEQLKKRLKAVSARIDLAKSKEDVCKQIEEIVKIRNDH